MSAQESVTPYKPATGLLADKLKKKMSVGKDGVVSVPDDLYESTLADSELTMETVKQVQTHRTEFVSAMTLAVGELGIKAMEKNAKLDVVSADAKVGKDEVSVQLNRTREVNIPARGGEPMKKATQHGATVISYTVQGTANSGELKKVRQHILSEAQKVLAK